MMWLNKNPFPVRAYFEKSLVLGFAVPKVDLKDRIPPCLELDLFEDQWAFIAVAMVQTRDLRPKGFPKFLGRDFILIGYRIFVRYRNREGRRLRGLYIIGSHTDQPAMTRLGNAFTRYQYKVVSIDWKSGREEEVQSSEGLHVVARKNGPEVSLPEGSPFESWRKARRFAGPMPFTFSYEESTGSVGIVEGVRSSWIPEPVSILEWKVPFFEEFGLANLRLANAFMVENVPYEWKRGRVEKWKNEN